MKKAVALALAGLVLFSVVCFLPRAADARDSAECYRNHSTCRSTPSAWRWDGSGRRSC